MKKTLHTLLLAGSLLFAAHTQAQTICNANGNLFLYSNYDGGALTLNVDVNIPNIHIGIVSYEYVRVAITGTYAGNVTQVYYAGYNGTNNNCNLQGSPVTTITGATNATSNIVFAPNVTLSNPNGYSSIICGYSCDTASTQGGCNTVDQIVDYFQQTLGSTLYSHRVQYGCWPSQPVPLSSGGNCCIGSSGPSTAVAALPALQLGILQQNNTCVVTLPAVAAAQQVTLEVLDITGRVVYSQQVQPGTSQTTLLLHEFTSGLLFVRAHWKDGTASAKIMMTQ
ncbi:MAG: hypothetical protein IM638_01610 [Bacteroidetes bacterium]|nr:hypothetical protein [Bacteroidota bacterium]